MSEVAQEAVHAAAGRLDYEDDLRNGISKITLNILKKHFANVAIVLCIDC
jgi:hypothetical protein